MTLTQPVDSAHQALLERFTCASGRPPACTCAAVTADECWCPRDAYHPGCVDCTGPTALSCPAGCYECSTAVQRAYEYAATTTDAALLRLCAASQVEAIRFEAARNRSANADVLLPLATDPCEPVRRRVARNPAATAEVLRALDLTEASTTALAQVLAHPACPEDLRVALEPRVPRRTPRPEPEIPSNPTPSGLLALLDLHRSHVTPGDGLPREALREIEAYSAALLGEIEIKARLSLLDPLAVALAPGERLQIGGAPAVQGTDVRTSRAEGYVERAWQRLMPRTSETEARAWCALGYRADGAYEVSAYGVTLAVLIAYAIEVPGLHLDPVARSVRWGLTSENLADLHRAGLPHGDISEVSRPIDVEGWPPQEAAAAALLAHALGLQGNFMGPDMHATRPAVAPFINAGLTTAEAVTYARAGLTVAEALDLRTRSAAGEDVTAELALLTALHT